MSITDAVTKNRQGESMLRAMTTRALGRTVRDFTADELGGGLCSAVYRICADGETVVLKIASAPEVVTMRHERKYLQIEAEMLRTFNKKLHIPIPQLIALDETCEICPVPYFFMSFMPGKPLMLLDPKPDEEAVLDIKRGVGQICRAITNLEAPSFGIPYMPETYCGCNADFILLLFRMLLDDAADCGITLPGITPEALLALIESQRSVLNQAEKPYYVHTDTWDGNVMVQDQKLTGLIDFAAILWGDPLMNHDFHTFSREPGFEEGFGKTEFNEDERIRIEIYRVWQQLGMIVERGFRQYADKNLYFWVYDVFRESVSRLCKMTGQA